MKVNEMFCRFYAQIHLQQEILFVGPSKKLVLSAGSVTILGGYVVIPVSNLAHIRCFHKLWIVGQFFQIYGEIGGSFS